MAATALDFLAQHPLLQHAQPTTLAELAEITRERQLGAGEPLFAEGDPGQFVFIVVCGRLQATKQVGEGRPVVLRELYAGDVGGLTSMAASKARSASIRAITAAQLYEIPSTAFRALWSSHSDLACSVVAFMGEKMRDKTSQLASVLADGPRDPRPQVVVFDSKPYDRTHLQAAGHDLAFQFLETRLDAETAKLAAGQRLVCAFVNDDLSAPVLETLAAGGVELVALRCAGFNQVDLVRAKQLGISVTRVPAYSPHAVAEHAMALTLTLNRKTHRAYQRVREGNFSLAGLEGRDLHGRTAGVVGTGNIGRCFASIAHGFGMRVLLHDPFPQADLVRSGAQYVSLRQLLSEADLVSLHAPLTAQTRHMINAESLALTRPGVLLINTSRGALIDTGALVDGLKRGHIGGAGLDVYEEESGYFFEDRSGQVLSDDVLARLLTFPNVLITSHQAFLTTDALDNIANTTCENIRQFLEGRRGAALENGLG